MRVLQQAVPARSPHPFSRRSLLQGATMLAGIGLSRLALAEEVDVPVRAQAELLAKVAGYDRRFAGRAQNGEARLLVLIRPGDADSERVGNLFGQQLVLQPLFGGCRPLVSSLGVTGADAVASAVRERKPAAICFSTGLSGIVPELARALSGADVLSVSLVAHYAALGAVLAFELSAGRPRLVVNLPQAKRQNVAFTPQLLQLARVIQ